MRIAIVEWPEALAADAAWWAQTKDAVAAAQPDVLVTNELPFGAWIADSGTFSEAVAGASIQAHEDGLARLAELGVPAIISSRPVWNGTRLANEAFVLEGGVVRVLHRKQYFPDEPGWFEADWYAGDGSGFAVTEVLGVKVGVLLCTEAMFNEHARGYGRQGASLIVVPRATGFEIESWKIAGAMAALVSGAYVVSSNRSGRSAAGIEFGGGGFAYAPQGRLLTVTTPAEPLQVFALETDVVAAAQRDYPCYVRECT